MKFFTLDWHQGCLSDAEYDEAIMAYARQLEGLRVKMPAGVQQLTFDVSFHDARIQRICIDRESSAVVIVYCCGDLQKGYTKVVVRYRDVELELGLVHALIELGSTAGVEIVTDETDFDRICWVHRMMLSLGDSELRELELRFQGCSVEWSTVCERGNVDEAPCVSVF